VPRFLTREELGALRGEVDLLRLAANSEDAITSALGQAEAEASSYLLSRYGDRLPSTPETAPAVLKAKVAALAHRLLSRSPQVAQALIDDAKDARDWFKAVARNQASLDLPDIVAQPVDRANPLILTTPSDPDRPPPLDWESLKGW
jgi:phage gp36-like protein